MTVQYGDKCMSHMEVYEWVDRFKGRRTSVVDDGHSLRSLTVTCGEVKK